MNDCILGFPQLLLNVVVLPAYVTTSLCLKLYSQYFTILKIFTFCLLKCLYSLWILGITCIKTSRPLSVFPRAFSVHEILSSYQHVLIIRMLHFLIIKLIPWQFHTCMTPVFSYLTSIPDNPLSSIWSPVPTFLCFVSFCGPLSLAREFCWAWTWSYLLKSNKLTTKDNGSSSSPNL